MLISVSAHAITRAASMLNDMLRIFVFKYVIGKYQYHFNAMKRSKGAVALNILFGMLTLVARICTKRYDY